MFDKALVNEIGAVLKEKDQSIAVAESVTSGLLQAALSNADEATLFYQGGITAYNLGQKTRHLLIDPVHALKCDCVSEKIAQDLSKNACKMFLSDYGIGITGYAATVPERDINELFAYYAICFKDKILQSGKIETDKEEGLPVQLYYTETVLKKFNDLLK